VATAAGLNTWTSANYSRKFQLNLSTNTSGDNDIFNVKIGGGAAVSGTVYEFRLGGGSDTAGSEVNPSVVEMCLGGTNGGSVQYINSSDSGGSKRLNIDVVGWYDIHGVLP
jgi:hypothetical protein